MAISLAYKNMLMISNSNRPPKFALKLKNKDILGMWSRHWNCADACCTKKSKKMLNNNGTIL
jgi:hypothetical protein